MPRRAAAKDDQTFPSWKEALKACWAVIRKEELPAFEINNWFYERHIKIQGAILFSIRQVRATYSSTAGARRKGPVATSRVSSHDPPPKDKYFFKAINGPMKAIGSEVEFKERPFVHLKRYRYTAQDIHFQGSIRK